MGTSLRQDVVQGPPRRPRDDHARSSVAVAAEATLPSDSRPPQSSPNSIIVHPPFADMTSGDSHRLEEASEESASEAPVPPSKAKACRAFLAVTALASTGAVSAIGFLAKPTSLAQADVPNAIVKDGKSGEAYALYHINHDGDVKSSSGVNYGVAQVVNRATTWDEADKLTAGGAWMLTKYESGKEYVCKTSPGPGWVQNGETYEDYWKPVFASLADKQGFDAYDKRICERGYALYHVDHDGDVKSSSGVNYGVAQVVNRATTWDEADKLTAGGAWMLTMREGGKEYVCKTSPGPGWVQNGETYEDYWKPVFEGLAEKQGFAKQGTGLCEGSS
ncbi:unnamed protein product [Prorocentrum cordatum]|uniref:Phospholipase B-like n=1 Tax=Prorocentrum cordatum TaxID=2364126 RepID=A0ABN9UEY4_9DINO|nr:unnamed protein product [Polarella glacialis]